MTEQSNSDRPNIYQRINAVRQKVDYIKRDARVETGQGKGYSAVTHDAVVAMIRNHLIENGVITSVTLVECQMNPPLGDTKQRLFEAIFDVSFINMDEPKQAHTMRLPAHAMDSGDKAPGKAASYAVKVACLKLFSIETGESDESRFADGDEAAIEIFLGMIGKCPTIEALHSVYNDAVERVTSSEGLDRIVAATTARRKALMNEAKP
jgi:hypothetical protein